MNTALLTRELRPAAAFAARQFPQLRRMTDAEISSPIGRNYYLTPKAALAVESNPQVLLQNRLYDRETKRVIVYKVGGQAVCGIWAESHIQFGKLDQAMAEEVVVLAPEEIPRKVRTKKVEMTESFAFPFLPFDLTMLQSAVEREMKGENIGYKSAQFPRAIYRGIVPFDVYQIMHTLTSGCDPLMTKLPALRRILEVGSGLSLTSFIVSLFLPQAEVVGVEIDPQLLSRAALTKSVMKKKFGYSLPGIKLFLGDAFAAESARPEDHDAVIGWFPLGSDFSADRMIEHLQRLRPGGLFFQLYSAVPFSAFEDYSGRGFRQVMIETPHYLPVTVFERLG